MMLDSGMLSAPLLDHRGLDLDAVGRVIGQRAEEAPRAARCTGGDEIIEPVLAEAKAR